LAAILGKKQAVLVKHVAILGGKARARSSCMSMTNPVIIAIGLSG